MGIISVTEQVKCSNDSTHLKINYNEVGGRVPEALHILLADPYLPHALYGDCLTKYECVGCSGYKMIQTYGKTAKHLGLKDLKV